MARCVLCGTDLDGGPVAVATAHRKDGSGLAWWSVCLPCGAATGGEFEGITLTPDGLAAAAANLTTAAKAVADLLSSTTDIDAVLEKYRR